jgi:hypothetical protein
MKKNEEITHIEDLNLTYIDRTNGRVKMIKCGRDFEKWDKDKQNEYLRVLCSSYNSGLDKMQQERDAMAIDMKTLTLNAKNADRRVEIMKMTQQGAIEDLNRQLNEMAAEKSRLARKLKELEG